MTVVAGSKNTALPIMARPRVYATDEERQAALRASWQKYNAAHRAERAAHNTTYCQRGDIKQRRKELRVARSIAKRPADATPSQEIPVPTLQNNPSTVLDILSPQPPVPVLTNPVLPQPEDVEFEIAPDAPQQVLGPQDFYTASQEDVYKYYPYTTVRRT